MIAADTIISLQYWILLYSLYRIADKISQIYTLILSCQSGDDLIVELYMSQLRFRYQCSGAEGLYRDSVFIKGGGVFDTERYAADRQRYVRLQLRLTRIYPAHDITVHIRIVGREDAGIYGRLRIVFHQCRKTQIPHASVARSHFPGSYRIFPVIYVYLLAGLLISVFDVLQCFGCASFICYITDTLIYDCSAGYRFYEDEPAFEAYLIKAAAVGVQMPPGLHCLLISGFRAFLYGIGKEPEIVIIKDPVRVSGYHLIL